MNLATYRVPFVNRLFGSTKVREVKIGTDAVEVGSTSYALERDGQWTSTSFFIWRKVGFSRTAIPACEFLLRRPDAAEFLVKIELGRLGLRSRPAIQAVLALRPQWNDLTGALRYVRRHEVDQFTALATPLIAKVPPEISALLEADSTIGWKGFVAAVNDALSHVAKANNAFVAAELVRQRPWFDKMPRPPTPRQREIAIRDETNSLVVAGAGTGKTSTILTKIAYLVHTRLAAPEEIVVVAFNRDAAQEIRDRCEAQGISGVSVETFHALGLAILGNVEGAKPAVLSQLETDQGREELVEQLVAKRSSDPQFAADFARFVLLYARPSFGAGESPTKEQYVRQTKAFLTKSLQGEWVRSTEELRIANWLFAHGLKYSYETPFGGELKTPSRRQYRPDFTIFITERQQDGTECEKLVYLEHQALDESGNSPPWMTGYAEKVRWARATHQQAKTTLIESFSWWFRKGVWEEKLKQLLFGVGVVVPKVDWRLVLRSAEDRAPTTIQWERKSALGLIRRSLDLVRTIADGTSPSRPVSGGISGTANHPSTSDLGRFQLFEALFDPVYRSYEEYKRAQQGIDFEDMIFQARQAVERGAFIARWSHYIVDEFQDASASRLRLLLSLRRQRVDTRLLCVGDDWQSIIRFAGSDIRVMTQFEQRVGPFWRTDLDQTFRSSSNIASLSREFVLQNPNQLKKELRPAQGRREFGIRIVFTAPPVQQLDDDPPEAFRDVFFDELNRISSEFSKASVLVLSRYRRGVPTPEEQRSIREKFPSLNLSWSTAHAAKGREADAVIVGDLNDSAFGFPCLREDDPIIARLLPPEDSFPCGEERRLFYVAMTRAKERLVLIANQQAPSPFVLELMRLRPSGDGLEIVRSGDSALKVCPACGAGTLVARDGVNGRFYGCTKSPACSYTEEACPSCRRGMLVASEGRFACTNSKCGHTVRMCPRCRRGWLQSKTNRQTGDVFLGCSCFRDEESQCTYTEDQSGRRGRRRW